MKTIRALGLSTITLFTCLNTTQAAFNPSTNLKNTSYSINKVNKDGDTPLCLALKNNDMETYNELVKMGADTKHPCIGRLSLYGAAEGAATASAAEGSEWTTANYAWAGLGIAAVGGIAAAAGGGGGGGGSSNHNQGNQGNDNTIGGTSKEQSYFKTEEYHKGGFLSQINAAEAYARFYKVKDGKLVSNLKNVKVGIIDTGIYAPNKDFSGKSISGFNMDYGPCRQGRTKNCWSFSAEGIDASGGDVAYAEINDVVYKVSMTKEEFDEFAKRYPADYNWETASGYINGYYPNDYNDNYSKHGTHIAGIITANKDGNGMHGVAFDNVSLISGKWDFKYPLSEPIIEMIDRGARVINMSLGVPPSEDRNASNIAENPSLLSRYAEGFRYASQKKTVLVFSAGNESSDQPGIIVGAPLVDEFKAGSQYSLENLFISVVALNSEGTALAEYSNHCGATKNYCIGAPGTDIYSTSTYKEDYAYMRGTSMSAPVVTGSVAFLMGAYPYMTSQEVVKLIFETAKDLGAPGVDEVYGHGLLDLGAATRPVGNTRIATTRAIEGDSVSAKNTRMNVTGVFEGAISKAMPESITILDKYNRPFAMPISNFVNVTHHGKQNFKNDVYAFSKHKPIKRIESENGVSFAYAPSSIRKSEYDMGLIDVQYQGESHSFKFYYAENTKYNSDKYFDQKMFNPYLAMNQAYGFESGYKVGGKFNFNFGFATGENGLYDGGRDYNDYDFDNRAYAFNNEVSYAASESINLSAMSGVLYEDSALLGLNGNGGFNLDDSNTYYIGMALSWQATDRLSFSGVYYQGWTDAQNLSSHLMKTSRLVSDSFALDGRYQLSKEDLIGIQLSSPLRVYKGRAEFDIPVGRDDYSDEVYREKFNASMKPDAREYKFSLYHMREVSEVFNFKSQFDIRLNPDHVKGASTDYRAMFGLQYNF